MTVKDQIEYGIQEQLRSMNERSASLLAADIVRAARIAVHSKFCSSGHHTKACKELNTMLDKLGALS